MEYGLHFRLQNHLHDRLCDAVGNGGDAQRAYPSIGFRDFHEEDEVEGTIPTTCDSISYKGYPLDLSRTPSAIRRPRRPPLGFPSPVSRPPRRGVWKCRMALPRTSAHPVTGWLKILGGKVGSLRSTRITGLHHYYEPVRPCGPHRYCPPYGFAASGFSLSIGTQVPTFRTRACSRDRAA